jgi:hypothetical protein
MSGVETPQDKGVKDDFSIHVLKDVAICSNTFWIPRFAQNDDAPADSLLWGVVDHSTTPTHDAIKNPRPAESVAVCERKLQSKGLGFGARCKRSLAFAHSSRTETYRTRGSD